MARIISNYNDLPLPNKKIYDLVQKKTNGSVKAFAELIGVSQQVLDRIFKIDPRNSKYPSISDKIKEGLKSNLGIDEIWLLTEEDNILKKESQTKIEPNAHPIDHPNFMNVPLIPVRAQCGYLNGYGDQEYIDTLPTLPVIVDRTYHGKYRLFEAEGDSMDDNTRNAICDGDIVLGREVQRHLWTSKLHMNDWYFIIVHRTEGISIKQIIDHDVEHGIIICHPLNDLFHDYKVYLDEVAELYNVIKIVDRSARL